MEGYEEERAKIEIESSITNTELRGRCRTVCNWMPKGINNLLDVGCSWDLFKYLTLNKESTQCIIAIDIDQSKVSEGSKYYSNTNFICSDIQIVPFKANAFDLITILDVLEHVDNDKKAIEELWRILKPGGILILSVPHAGSFDFLDPDNLVYIRLYKILNRLGIINLKSYYLKPHKHYSLEDIKLLFWDKFEIIKVHRGGLILNPSIFLVMKSISLFFIYFKLRNIKWIDKIRNTFLELLVKIKELEYRIDFKEKGYHCVIYAIKKVA